MSPLDKALIHYEGKEDGADALALLYSYGRHGRVVIGPDLFVMARPVSILWSNENIANPYYNASPESGQELDCVHVEFLAGSLEEALALLPWDVQFVSFQRGVRQDYRLRIWNLETIRNYVRRRSPTTATISSADKRHESSGG